MYPAFPTVLGAIGAFRAKYFFKHGIEYLIEINWPIRGIPETRVDAEPFYKLTPSPSVFIAPLEVVGLWHHLHELMCLRQPPRQFRQRSSAGDGNALA
jgi:hypothetical protein